VLEKGAGTNVQNKNVNIHLDKWILKIVKISFSYKVCLKSYLPINHWSIKSIYQQW